MPSASTGTGRRRDGESPGPGGDRRRPGGSQGRLPVRRGVAGAVLGRIIPGAADPAASGRALAEVVPNDPRLKPDRSQLLKPHWPPAALAEGDWTYSGLPS